MEDRFLRGRQIAFMIHEYFRVTGAHEAVLDYSSSYKTRIRESDQLNSVLAMYEQEFNQNLSKPSYQKLKTMVKRHLDHKMRTRNSEARTKKLKQKYS